MFMTDNALFCMNMLTELHKGKNSATLAEQLMHMDNVLKMAYAQAMTYAVDSFAVVMVCAMAKAYMNRMDECNDSSELAKMITQVTVCIKECGRAVGIEWPED